MLEICSRRCENGSLTSRVNVFSASRVLCECSWNAERAQSHYRLYGWQNVLLEPGHALNSTGGFVFTYTGKKCTFGRTGYLLNGT